MPMIAIRGKNGQKGLPLPETGIVDDNGHLFHHASSDPVMPDHARRLEKHGIYLSRKWYSKEEIGKLRANWKEFAREHQLEVSDLLSLLNFRRLQGEAQRKTPEMIKKKEFIKNSFFWPKICDGLPTRAAKFIKYQLLDMFDPVNETERGRAPLSAEEERSAIQKYRRGMSIQELADYFGKSYRFMMKILVILLHREKFSRSERRKLWNVVYGQLDVKPLDVASLPLLKIDWSTVARCLFRDHKSIKNEWNLMVAELSELCSKGMSWDEAFEAAIPQCDAISPGEFSDFVDLFIEEKEENLDSLHCTKQEKTRIKINMIRRGITGFRTLRFSEYEFCRHKMGGVFSTIRRNLLEPIRLHLPLSAQLRLISRCFRAFAQTPCPPKRVQLKRHLVVNELIRQMSEDDPSWKPSRKLKKYIDQTF